MSENSWQDITIKPSAPTDVLLYAQNVVWTDYRTGAPATVPDRARYDVGYWDGTAFFYHGSNHAVFEFGDKPGDDDQHPTHWQPLPAPPQNNAPQTAETQAKSTTSPPLINQV